MTLAEWNVGVAYAIGQQMLNQNSAENWSISLFILLLSNYVVVQYTNVFISIYAEHGRHGGGISILCSIFVLSYCLHIYYSLLCDKHFVFVADMQFGDIYRNESKKMEGRGGRTVLLKIRSIFSFTWICIFILFVHFRDVNNNIMELLIMAYACKTSSARSIVGVIPYLPYSKQCKMRKRGCIVSKLLAKVRYSL